MSRLVWGALLCLMWSASARADGHLVAVASNLGLSDEPELRYAEQDARALRDVLQQLGTHQPLHEHMLIGSSAINLEDTIKALPITPDDTLYVYFSGHADARGLHVGEHVIPFDTLKSTIESLPARMKLLIIDACNSGQATRNKGVKPAAPFSVVLDDRLGVSGTAIVTSSADSEHSQESDELGASFFTFHLLQGLRGAADRDHDRRVTLNEAFGYASRQTLRSTAFTRQLQHPTFKGKLFGQDTELVLSRLDAAPASASLWLEGPAQYLVFDNHDELFAEITVENTEAQYLMPSGRWLFQRRTHSGAEEQWVQLSAGQERALSSKDASPVPLTRLAAKGRADNGTQQRLQLLAGALGSPVEGRQALPSVWLGYRAKVLGVELGAELSAARDVAHNEIFGARVKAYYGRDIGIVRLGGCLALGVDLQRQRAPHEVTQLYPGAGASAFVDVRLYESWALHVEAGPSLHVLKIASMTSSETRAAVSWWLAAGPTWGFQ